MTDEEMDEHDRDIPEQALKALAEASQRALQSGCDVVVVENDQLVKITPNGKIVLRDMPPRIKSTVHIKRTKRT